MGTDQLTDEQTDGRPKGGVESHSTHLKVVSDYSKDSLFDLVFSCYSQIPFPCML